MGKDGKGGTETRGGETGGGEGCFCHFTLPVLTPPLPRIPLGPALAFDR